MKDKLIFNKVLINLFLIILVILIVSLSVLAITGSSGNYTLRSKFDSASQTNASSSNFTQRFITGNQPVSQYTTSSFSGRLGILEFSASNITITSPSNNSEIPRGSDSVANEDDLGLVSNYVVLNSYVSNLDNNLGIQNINCSFYFNGSLVGSSLTNSSGYCIFNYDKSSRNVGGYYVTSNYSASDYDINIPSSTINMTIISYNLPNFAGGKGVASQYADNQTAKFYFNVTKTNLSGTVLYDPLNVSINATTSSGILYPESAYVTGYRLVRNGVGQYESRVVVNKTLGSLIKWNIYTSNDNYTTYIATGVHSDIGIALGAICGNTLLETGEQCDDGNLANGDGCSSTCTTESTGGSCFPGYILISMADGSKKQIKDVKIGENVLAYDTQTSQTVYAKVLELESPLREGIYQINGIINVTDEHPFYIKKKDGKVGWGAINNTHSKEDSKIKGEILSLEKGDYLLNSQGDWIEINEIVYYPGEIRTYNLKRVDNYNNFFANGFLVHNKGEIVPTCTNECAFGETETTCVTSGTLRTRTCGNYDSDSCTEWGGESFAQCSNGQTCSNAQCTSCTENWQCNSWSQCSTGNQTRTCTDSNSCGTFQSKPLETQSCTVCTENWQCSWTECQKGDKSSSPYDCVDLNACGTQDNKPTNTVLCADRPTNETYFSIKPDAICGNLNWKCNSWGECNAKYDLHDVITGKSSKQGYQVRTCDDLSNCALDKNEKQQCKVSVPIRANVTQWCGENYVDIYDVSNGKLVSRIKQTAISNVSNFSKVDISLITTDFGGYCNSCYDGIKNNDETNIDCGGSCSVCLKEYKYFDWLFWLILILWALFVILSYKYYRVKSEETGVGLLGRLKSISGKEDETEERIESWFKGISKKPSERPRRETERRIVEIPEKDRLLSRLKRKLKEYRRDRYYGTAELEKEIRELERKGSKSEVKVKSWFGNLIELFKERREQKRKKKEIKKHEKNVKLERAKGKSFISMLFSGWKENREIKKRRIKVSKVEKIRKKSMFTLWFEKFKERRKERKHEKKAKEIYRVKKKSLIKEWFNKFKERRKEKRKKKEIKKQEKNVRETYKVKKSSLIKNWFNKFKENRRNKKYKKEINRPLIKGSLIRSIFRKFKQKKAIKKHEKLIVKEKVHEKTNKKSFIKKVSEKYNEWALIRKHKKEVREKLQNISRDMKKKLHTETKERKVHVRSLKREIRTQKIANLMRKLRIWRKEGYYGTAKLEAELRKLKDENKRKV